MYRLFVLESPYRGCLPGVRAPVLVAEEDRATITVDDVPAPFIDARVSHVDDGGFDTVACEESNSTTICSESKPSVKP